MDLKPIIPFEPVATETIPTVLNGFIKSNGMAFALSPTMTEKTLHYLIEN